ncbi:MAG: hypothetical protein ACE5KZ_08725 [Candidatus Scalinduaceae bacterium]
MAEVKDIKNVISEDLNSWGAGLIIMGILHFVLSSLLWAEWGIVLIIIGILCFIVKHRIMFIILGMGLMLIGFLNGLGGLESSNSFWTIFGGFQIYWGIKEIVKFKTYEQETVLSHLPPEADVEDSAKQNQLVRHKT